MELRRLDKGAQNAGHSPRHKTHQVFVGDIPVGGGAPIPVQSMTCTKTDDADATLSQIKALADAGAAIVRVAVPDKGCFNSFESICKASPVPLVADIHFDYRLAIEAAKRGAFALRINPGNIGEMEKVDAVIEAAKKASIPIRIGVNEGSLAKEIEEDASLNADEKLVGSAVAFVKHFRSRDFLDIVVSAKTHDVMRTISVNRALSEALPSIPLHLGVTEAGSAFSGTIKNVSALSALLAEGIGDTIRVSLTADPVEEVRVGKELLKVLGLGESGPEIVSCPTCGRTKINLERYVAQIEEALKDCTKDITVAVMGCVVNGPGEAKHADIGIAGGDGSAILFERGEIVKNIPEDQIVPELLAAIERDF